VVSQSAYLFCRLFAHEYVACVGGCSRINRHISLIDVLNDAVLVDNKCGPIAEALFFIKDSVVFHYGSLEITEQWKRDTNVLCEAAVGGNAVDTDSKHLGIGSFEFGDISLIRLQFLRSTTSKGQHIEGQHYIFLSLEVAQFHPLAGSAR
jgi:hypothetical protein